VSAYAEDDTHPAKHAAEAAAQQWGWQAPEWYAHVRAAAIPRLATVERAQSVLDAAGVRGVARAMQVAFPELGREQLLAWRFGMAQLAPFVASLADRDRSAMWQRALDALDHTELVRSIIVVVAVAD
jgi:hypothetical protein